MLPAVLYLQQNYKKMSGKCEEKEAEMWAGGLAFPDPLWGSAIRWVRPDGASPTVGTARPVLLRPGSTDLHQTQIKLSSCNILNKLFYSIASEKNQRSKCHCCRFLKKFMSIPDQRIRPGGQLITDSAGTGYGFYLNIFVAIEKNNCCQVLWKKIIEYHKNITFPKSLKIW